jgi:hypothetical protein
MHQGTKSRGVGHRQGSGRYKDCVLASPSVEGMASGRGDVGVKRGVHLIEQAECTNRRLADQAWGRKAATGIGERVHNFCVLA